MWLLRTTKQSWLVQAFLVDLQESLNILVTKGSMLLSQFWKQL